MNSIATLAPVRKSILVATDPQSAFEVFTDGLDRWWPRKASIGEAPMRRVGIEPRLGGRWYEVGQDGSEATIGKVLAWDPPRRFVVSWDVSCRWKSDGAPGSEVEVRFIKEASGTRVELEHRLFERMEPEAGASMRKDVDGGWPGMLDHFKAEVERAMQAT
jgi:uncharacterized protein YndB with AHSA1/START domain